jgi:hypothetical protein
MLLPKRVDLAIELLFVDPGQRRPSGCVIAREAKLRIISGKRRERRSHLACVVNARRSDLYLDDRDKFRHCPPWPRKGREMLHPVRSVGRAELI